MNALEKWNPLRGSSVWDPIREMQEMRYLWRQPLRLSNERLSAVLAAEPRTPLEQAVRTTLTGLGCLKSQ